jgi:hypothetical protein
LPKIKLGWRCDGDTEPHTKCMLILSSSVWQHARHTDQTLSGDRQGGNQEFNVRSRTQSHCTEKPVVGKETSGIFAAIDLRFRPGNNRYELRRSWGMTELTHATFPRRAPACITAPTAQSRVVGRHVMMSSAESDPLRDRSCISLGMWRPHASGEEIGVETISL